jgi:hypothetical protein
MNLQETISHFKELEKLQDEANESMRQAYVLRYRYRNALKALKSNNCLSYPQFSSKARRLARREMGRGRGQIDHQVSCKLLWLLGFTPEQASDKRNLKRISRDLNRKKGIKCNWELFNELYLPLLKEHE